METLVFEGRKYLLTFEGREETWKYWSGGDGGDHENKMYEWQGTGEIEERGKDRATFFHYSTEPLSGHPLNWFHLHSFEHCLFFIRKELRGNPYRTRADTRTDDPDCAVYFKLELVTDRLAVIDYFAELIWQALNKADQATIFPSIQLPELSVDELIRKSLIGESDGQLRLAEVTN